MIKDQSDGSGESVKIIEFVNHLIRETKPQCVSNVIREMQEACHEK